ncbi:hydantoinase/oxoprolinase family protein [Alsobacter sp. R-9]
MDRFVIGIDTGGTYTDAALVDGAARRVVARAKALTTRGDLAVGVGEALAAVLAEADKAGIGPRDISRLCLSTTLATNAIVEGHGSHVAVILVGFDDAMAERTGIAATLPGTPVLRVAGGHDHAGQEQAPLDLVSAEAFVGEMKGRVAAYAVASHYAVRNPAHEHAVRNAVERIAGVPTSLSVDLSRALDAPRRALTAALNARIIARIAALVAAVRQAMVRNGLDAPLMVVKGDGSLAAADLVARRPIETILSGPAASVVGARFLSGLDDFVVSDVGGTTTDVATVEKGWPRLDREGAVVGGRRTLVRAVAMRTYGLGGDSEATVAPDGTVSLKPNRVVPLSLMAARHPAVIDRMRLMLDDPQGEPHAGHFVMRPFARKDGADPRGLGVREAEILAVVGDEPVPLGRVVHGPTRQKALERLVAQGLLHVAGYTPSDAAHVLGRQGQWNREGAVLGGLLLQRRLTMVAPGTAEDREAAALAFAEAVTEAMVRQSGRVLIASLVETPPAEGDPFVEAVASGTGRVGGLAVSLRPAVPLVAVGGPAPVFYPEVARRLGCELVLAEHADVANAVGAAVALVRARASVEVTSAGPGLWRVHGEGEPVSFMDPSEALAAAVGVARAQARATALAMGGEGTDIEHAIDRADIPGALGDKGLVAATVIASCWGAAAPTPAEGAAAPIATLGAGAPGATEETTRARDA